MRPAPGARYSLGFIVDNINCYIPYAIPQLLMTNSRGIFQSEQLVSFQSVPLRCTTKRGSACLYRLFVLTRLWNGFQKPDIILPCPSAPALGLG